MSDDLERAALVVSRATGQPGMLLEFHRHIARAALLSFLDMDEAGLARIERAIWESGREAGNITGEESWRSYRAECKGQARAVLSELRKMAGEKDG